MKWTGFHCFTFAYIQWRTKDNNFSCFFLNTLMQLYSAGGKKQANSLIHSWLNLLLATITWVFLVTLGQTFTAFMRNCWPFLFTELLQLTLRSWISLGHTKRKILFFLKPFRGGFRSMLRFMSCCITQFLQCFSWHTIALTSSCWISG